MLKSSHQCFARSPAIGAALLLFLATFLAPVSFPPFAALAQQTTHRKVSPPKTAPAKRLPDAPMPFRTGEALNYRVGWSAFTSAAAVQLSVVERRDLFGWGTWHFRASAHTLSPVRSLFAVDDQFDSYTDAATLESRQYEMYLDELGKTQDHVVRMVPPGEISKAPGPSVVVLPGTRDPLGALYVLRGVNWMSMPEIRAPVYDGHDVYEMRAKIETPGDTITVAAGKFACSRISIRVFQHGKEMIGIAFVIWFANDAARTPVQIQAELPFGNLHVELNSSSL